MSGIMNSNPFNVLQWSSLQSMAQVIRINILEKPDENLDDNLDGMQSINNIHVIVHDAEVVSAAVVTPPASPRRGDIDDIADNWTEVVRKSRGKHPRKRIL